MGPALIPDRVVVVGAGIAGAACAKALAAGGVAVTVLDRGRAPGGRMASPLLGERRVDVGASYFTLSDTGFERVVHEWHARRLVRQWTDTFDSYSSGTPTGPKSGPLRWAAPAGLRALVRDLLAGLPVESGVVVERIDVTDTLSIAGFAAEVVVLAMPDPQAARILQAATGAGLAVTPSIEWVSYEPVIAVTGCWSERHWPFVDGAFVNGHPILAFVADDGARRGDGAAVLVAHTTAEFAAAHLTDPSSAIPAVLGALCELFGFEAAPLETHVHRWSFAKPTGTHGDSPFLLTENGLALAGDSWCPQGAPRVESAWLSGTRLAAQILDL